jgi:hypothetical protein
VPLRPFRLAPSPFPLLAGSRLRPFPLASIPSCAQFHASTCRETSGSSPSAHVNSRSHLGRSHLHPLPLGRAYAYATACSVRPWLHRVIIRARCDPGADVAETWQARTCTLAHAAGGSELQAEMLKQQIGTQGHARMLNQQSESAVFTLLVRGRQGVRCASCRRMLSACVGARCSCTLCAS